MYTQYNRDTKIVGTLPLLNTLFSGAVKLDVDVDDIQINGPYRLSQQ